MLIYITVQIIVTRFVPRLWVMTLWKIFAVDTQLTVSTAKIFHNVTVQIRISIHICMAEQQSLRNFSYRVKTKNIMRLSLSLSLLLSFSPLLPVIDIYRYHKTFMLPGENLISEIFSEAHFLRSLIAPFELSSSIQLEYRIKPIVA